eukprot:2662019-Prymnesium_polylepis.1
MFRSEVAVDTLALTIGCRKSRAVSMSDGSSARSDFEKRNTRNPLAATSASSLASNPDQSMVWLIDRSSDRIVSVWKLLVVVIRNASPQSESSCFFPLAAILSVASPSAVRAAVMLTDL